MKKKTLVLMAGVGLSVGLLTGCGTPSVEKLVDDMYETDYDSATATVEFNLEGSASMYGTDIDAYLNADFDMEMQGIKDGNETVHADGTVKVGAMGESISSDVESYVVEDDDEVTTYAKTSDSDQWTYTTADREDSVVDEDTVNEIKDSIKEVAYGAELQEDLEEVNGEDCYVLTLETTLDDFSDVIDMVVEAADVEDDFDDLGLDDYYDMINMNYTFYVTKKGHTLVQVDVDMADTDFSGILEKAGADDYFDDLSIDEFSMKMTFADFDDVEVEVPDDVIDDAVESDSLTDMIESEEEDIEGEYSDGDIELEENPDIDMDVEDVEDYEYDASEEDAEEETEDKIYGGTCDLQTYDEEDILVTFTIPDGFYLDNTYSGDDYKDLIAEDGSLDFYVQNYIPSDCESALNGEVDTDLYEHYDYSSTELDVTWNGQPVYFVQFSYAEVDYPDDVYTKDYLLTTYEDSWGTEYLAIEFYDGNLYFTDSDYEDLWNSVFN